MEDQSLAFLHRLNDGGLLFLNHYLEEACGCHVLHISPSNRLIYDGDDREQAERLRELILRSPQERDCYIDAERRFMVFRTRVNELRNLFVFYPIDEEKTKEILNCLNEISNPVNCFLRGLYHSFTHNVDQLSNKPEQIFQPDNTYWLTILSTRMIDPDSSACVILYDANDGAKPAARLCSSVMNLALRDGGSDILNYSFGNRVVQIVPSSYTVLTGPGGPRKAANRYPVYLHKQELDELLSLNVSITVGHTVAYRDIYQSYLSAMMADYYLQYFKRTPQVLRFEEIGPFQRLFRTDFSRQKDELAQKYKILMQHESERSGCLFSTARELVRSQFNYQAAALDLHIHLNTLYYRQEKISKILSVNLTSFEAKVMLCDEMFLNDFFRFLQEEKQRH